MKSKRSSKVLSRRSVLGLASIAASMAVMPQPAYASKKSDLKKTEAQLAAAEEQLAEAEAQLEAIAAEYEELSIAQSATLDELDAVEKQIAKITKRIKKLEAQLKAKQDELAQMIANEYKDGNHGVVELIVGASSVEEVISNLYYYDKVTEDKANLIQEVKDARADLEAEKVELKAEQANLEEVSKQQAEQLAAMQDKQYEAQLVIDGLDKEVHELMEKRDAELLAAQKEAERARQEREAAAAAAAAAAQAQAQQQEQSSSSSSSSEQSSSSSASQDESPSSEETPSNEESSSSEESSSNEQSQENSSEDSETEQEPEEESEDTESYDDYEEDYSGGSGTGSAAAVVASCKSTPSPGAGLCAGWCSNVMANAGYGYVAGNANDMYANYCHSSNRADLRPGMAVAVSTHPHTTMGRIYGHIGMYIGGGTMMDNIGYIRTISVDEWCDFYGATVSPRWGWLNGIVLT